ARLAMRAADGLDRAADGPAARGGPAVLCASRNRWHGVGPAARRTLHRMRVPGPTPGRDSPRSVRSASLLELDPPANPRCAAGPDRAHGRVPAAMAGRDRDVRGARRTGRIPGLGVPPEPDLRRNPGATGDFAS